MTRRHGGTAEQWTAETVARRNHVDEVAVQRAIGGQRTHLTVGERKAAVDELTEQGYSCALIAERIGLSPRTVQRYRAGDWHKTLRLRTPEQ